MVTLAEYFANNRYQATYEIGDRVFGKWNKIPFIGSVGNDSVVNEEQGPRVSIHLDLPIKVKDKVHTLIFVKPTDIKRLKTYE